MSPLTFLDGCENYIDHLGTITAHILMDNGAAALPYLDALDYSLDLSTTSQNALQFIVTFEKALIYDQIHLSIEAENTITDLWNLLDPYLYNSHCIGEAQE